MLWNIHFPRLIVTTRLQGRDSHPYIEWARFSQTSTSIFCPFHIPLLYFRVGWQNESALYYVYPVSRYLPLWWCCTITMAGVSPQTPSHTPARFSTAQHDCMGVVLQLKGSKGRGGKYLYSKLSLNLSLSLPWEERRRLYIQTLHQACKNTSSWSGGR